MSIIVYKGKPEPRELDFTHAFSPRGSKAGRRHVDDSRLSKNPKAIRNRARRRGGISTKEFEQLYKPIDEWDDEELRRGRPRAADGSFRGKAPPWMSRELHEQAMDRFKAIIGDRMREETVNAMGVVSAILANDEIDEKGRPVVPASVKLDAAKWLVEHLLGKPKQHTETDISVKLQAVLATAMVGPGGLGMSAPTTSVPGLPGPAVMPTWASEGLDGVDAEVADDD